MARIEFENWLLSVEKWAAVVRGCMLEDERVVKDALTGHVCGYCREDVRRMKGNNSYRECSKCALEKRMVCGEESGPDGAYFVTEDPEGEYTWKQRQRASKKLFQAIMEDAPAFLRPMKWRG